MDPYMRILAEKIFTQEEYFYVCHVLAAHGIKPRVRVKMGRG